MNASMDRFRHIDKRDIARETYYVRIFSSSKDFNIRKLEPVMDRLYLTFHKGFENNADCYEREYVTADELDRLKEALFRYKDYIAIKYCLQKYARNSRYRTDFFGDSRKMYYRCAYCGRKVDRMHLDIDHIFPVQKMMDDEKTRRHARFFGIYETNSVKNLAPACSICNKAKGSSTGLWVIRGLLGRSGGFFVVKGFEIALIVIGLLFMLAMFNLDKIMDIVRMSQVAFK